MPLIDDVIERMFCHFDELVNKGRFDLIDQELAKIDLAKPTDILIAYLFFTLSYCDKLKNRKEAWEKIYYIVWRRRQKIEADELMMPLIKL